MCLGDNSMRAGLEADGGFTAVSRDVGSRLYRAIKLEKSGKLKKSWFLIS
jgi:hypothetical protein